MDDVRKGKNIKYKIHDEIQCKFCVSQENRQKILSLLSYFKIILLLFVLKLIIIIKIIQYYVIKIISRMRSFFIVCSLALNI